MTRRPRPDSDQPLLDLTLRPARPVPATPDAAGFSHVAHGDPLQEREHTPASGVAGAPANRRARWLAAGADGLILVGVGASALLAVSALGGELDGELWPGLAVFLVAFSFLYATLPLLFWGQTPGMAWAGIRAADRDEQPVTFRQSVLRWLGSLLTCATLGLPLLLRRSLADRLSGSMTLRATGGAYPLVG